MSLKHFDETYGGWGAQGYLFHEDAEKTMGSVIEEMRKVRGIQRISVCLEEKGGRYWVRNRSSYISDVD